MHDGVLLVFGLLLGGLATAHAEDDVLARGQRVYAEKKCAACHAIAGKGNRRHPLDGVGSRLDTAALRAWIVAPATMNPEVEKPKYDDLPPADVDALVAYLKSLR
jgi:mono/diheme cytochrome c family protein